MHLFFNEYLLLSMDPNESPLPCNRQKPHECHLSTNVTFDSLYHMINICHICIKVYIWEYYSGTSTNSHLSTTTRIFHPGHVPILTLYSSWNLPTMAMSLLWIVNSAPDCHYREVQLYNVMLKIMSNSSPPKFTLHISKQPSVSIPWVQTSFQNKNWISTLPQRKEV